MRQHRDNPVHQIHTGTALFGFSVQCRILLHIVGHIRNMDPQLVSAGALVKRNIYRIIQIFGILTVNGNNHHITQIFSACHVSLADFICHTLRLIKHFFREFHGQIIAFYN